MYFWVNFAAPTVNPPAIIDVPTHLIVMLSFWVASRAPMFRKGGVGPSHHMRSGTTGYHIFDDCGCFGMVLTIIPGNSGEVSDPKAPPILSPKVVA